METLVDSHDLIGKTIGDYRVMRRLGEGGMGAVYLTEQVSLKRPVALKILKPALASNPESLQRFKYEAEAVAKASHPNIVQVYAVGDLNGLPYIALEYIDGLTLRDYIAKKGSPSEALAIGIMRQGAAALLRAAELGIVHRDIKPENILLTRKGVVKIADFGLSRCSTPDQAPVSLTQTGVTMGTPLYMSPEQVQGKTLDPRSDIYSFGVTCYHMLAGAPPFQGETAFDIAVKHVQASPPPLHEVRPDLSAGLCSAIHRMMAKKPDDRYQSARELLKDLARIREGNNAAPTAPVATMPTTPSAASSPRLRRRILFGSILTLALIVGAMVGWATRPALPLPAEPQANPEPVAEESANSAIQVTREQRLREEVREFTAGASVPRPQGLRSCFQLAGILFEQGRFDEADKFFASLVASKQGKDVQALGQLGLAMVLSFQDQARESTAAFKELVTGPDPPLARLAPALNRNPPFLKWVVRSLDRNAVNLATFNESLPPDLETLRRARPLSGKLAPGVAPGRPARKSP